MYEKAQSVDRVHAGAGTVYDICGAGHIRDNKSVQR